MKLPDDIPQAEPEPTPLERCDAEMEGALAMPDTGARHQQFDRVADRFGEVLRADPGNLALALRRVAALFLASGKSSDRIAAARASAAELSAMAQGQDRIESTHALAVAALVGGDPGAAEAAYRSLAGRKDADLTHLALARHFARHLSRAAGLQADRFDSAFPPLRLIVFSGHLPPRVDEACGEIIGRELEELGAEVGVASAAAGGDLLFLECLHARGGESHVILPWSRDSFRETSVRPFGGSGSWERKYDAAIAAAASIREIGEFAGPDSAVAWQYLLEVSAGIAMDIARKRHLDVVPLAVWDGKPGHPGGTADFCDFWKGQLGVEPRILAPPAGATAAQAPKPVAPASHRAESRIIEQSVKSMLFVDVVGFSKLPEAAVPAFVDRFLGEVSKVVARSAHAPHTMNTWGDALYAVFDFVRDAGCFALELNEMVESKAAEWESLGLGTLRIRTGLHSGPVYLHQDPIVRRLGFSGAHVNRAARIEPVADPGGILASEEFAALASITPGIGFSVEYARSGRLYKGYPGVHRLYRVVRDRSADLLLLARAIHEGYCETARARGDVPGANSALVPWDDLPPGLQSANLAQAEDIPRKLRALGYEIVESGGVPATEIVLDPQLVEPLARLEHDRWMSEKLRAGWVYDPVRDNAQLRHPLLVPYDDLPEREKEKDRDTVRNIPMLLAKAKCLVKPL